MTEKTKYDLLRIYGLCKLTERNGFKAVPVFPHRFYFIPSFSSEIVAPLLGV